MRLAVTSDRMSAAEITDFVDRFVIDRLATLDGVASVTINGQRRYAMRIWLDRTAMAARNITVADVEQALRRSNVELPAGESRSTVNSPSSLPGGSMMPKLGRVAQVAGYPVKLGDIAQVARGVEDDRTNVRANNVEAIGLAVLRQSQANTVAISKAVRAEIEALKPMLPDGMRIEVGPTMRSSSMPRSTRC